MSFGDNVQDPFVKVQINRWAVSYMLDESIEINLNRFKNISEVVEEFCVFLERAAGLKINRGKPLDMYQMIEDEWPRFATKLRS